MNKVAMLGSALMLALSSASAQVSAQVATPSWPPLDRAVDVKDAGAVGARDVAVIVGVSDYLILPDIAGAADNAIDWQATEAVRFVALKEERAQRLSSARVSCVSVAPTYSVESRGRRRGSEGRASGQ